MLILSPQTILILIKTLLKSILISFGGGGKSVSRSNVRYFLDDDVFNFNDCVVWRKIYRKSKITDNKLEFLEDSMIEDTYFNYTLLSYINKIVYLEDYVGYIRHVQYDSMTHSSNYDRVKEIINNAFDLHSIYKKNRKDVDISWLIAPFLDASLLYIYSSDIINDKKKVYDLLNDIYALEKETNFNESYLNISLKTANKLIMKKQFKLAIVNLKLLRKLYGNESFMKVYRKITYPS